jgi:IS5 family transposase
MPRRRIGQETLFEDPPKRSSLDEIAGLIDWAPVEAALDVVHASPRGEASWPPLAMFRALLLATWHDLSDVKLAEALDDRASFRRFCGFARTKPTPERTAFVRFRAAMILHGLDAALFAEIAAQLKARAVTVKTGTLVDATVVGSASEGDAEARWSGHRSRKAIHGYKAHIGADADTAIVEKIAVTPGNAHDGRSGHMALGSPPNPTSISYADTRMNAHLDLHVYAHIIRSNVIGEGAMQPQPLAKKATNLSLDQALLQEARDLGVNLSQAAEHGLRQAVANAKADAWKRENRVAIESSNAWVEQRGLPLDRFRLF